MSISSAVKNFLACYENKITKMQYRKWLTMPIGELVRSFDNYSGTLMFRITHVVSYNMHVSENFLILYDFVMPVLQLHKGNRYNSGIFSYLSFRVSVC